MVSKVIFTILAAVVEAIVHLRGPLRVTFYPVTPGPTKSPFHPS
jgi:hypothetical protein